MDYVIGFILTLIIVTPLCLIWVRLIDNQKDHCEKCDPDTCPFPCERHNTKERNDTK